MFSFQNMAISDGLIASFVLPESALFIEKLGLAELNNCVRGLPMLCFTLLSFSICLIPENNYRNQGRLSILNLMLCIIAFVLSFLCLSSESVFVYYNF